MQRTGKLGLAALGAALACAVFYLYLQQVPAPQVAFTSIQGERIGMQDLRGKVVLVNFWATDCPGCIAELPKMVETFNKYHAQGFEYVAVAMQYDRPDYVLNYTEKNALPFKVALDPQGALARAFGDVQLTPTTFIIDKRGNIVMRILGEPDFVKLRRLLEEKLREAA